MTVAHLAVGWSSVALPPRPSVDVCCRAVADEKGGLLTARELELLGLVRNGLNDKEIAERLGIGTRMVQKHVQSICQKLRCKSRSHAVAMALRDGLLDALEP